MHNKCQYWLILNSCFWALNMIIVNQTALVNGEHYLACKVSCTPHNVPRFHPTWFLLTVTCWMLILLTSICLLHTLCPTFDHLLHKIYLISVLYTIQHLMSCCRPSTSPTIFQCLPFSPTTIASLNSTLPTDHSHPSMPYCVTIWKGSHQSLTTDVCCLAWSFTIMQHAGWTMSKFLLEVTQYWWWHGVMFVLENSNLWTCRQHWLGIVSVKQCVWQPCHCGLAN